MKIELKEIMKKIPKILFFFFAFFLALSFFRSFIFAQFPLIIHIQGKLTDKNNLAVPDGYYNIEFKLWKDPFSTSSENLVWTETCTDSNRILVKDGLFSHFLGSISSLENVNFNQPLWLGINIGGTSTPPVWDGEMVPRWKIGAVPTAIEAKRLSGFTWEAPGQIGILNPNVGIFSSLEVIENATLKSILSTSSFSLVFQENYPFQIKMAGDSPFTFLEINSEGDLVLRAKSGKIRIDQGTTLYIGDIPIFSQGQEIIRQIIPIKSSDLPLRCQQSCYYPNFARVSKTLGSVSFPSPLPGTQRKFRFIIRYADTWVNSSSTWQIVISSNNSIWSTFNVPSSDSEDLEIANVFISDLLDLPNQPWYLRVQVGGNESPILQIYEIFLAIIDYID